MLPSLAHFPGKERYLFHYTLLLIAGYLQVIATTNEIVVPSITRTPGTNCGAQFFKELLLEKAEIEVLIYAYVFLYNYYIILNTDL